MRKTTMVILAVIGVAGFSTPSPADHQRGKSRYVHGKQLPRDYERAYALCYDLALRRGHNVSRGDWYSREKFIADCLAGKIPF